MQKWKSTRQWNGADKVGLSYPKDRRSHQVILQQEVRPPHDAGLNLEEFEEE